MDTNGIFNIYMYLHLMKNLKSFPFGGYILSDFSCCWNFDVLKMFETKIKTYSPKNGGRIRRKITQKKQIQVKMLLRSHPEPSGFPRYPSVSTFGNHPAATLKGIHQRWRLYTDCHRKNLGTVHFSVGKRLVNLISKNTWTMMLYNLIFSNIVQNLD